MRRRVCNCLFLALLVCSRVSASIPVTGSEADRITLRVAPGGSRVSATQPGAIPSIGVDISRMFAALAIVIGLIFLARWFLKRFYNGSVSPAGSSRAVQVLHRTVLAPKQQVMLLQVGRRVIVVGESNGGMTTLAQIDDADEIAQLVGKLNDEHTSRGTAFGGLFGRAQRKLEGDREEPETLHAANDDVSTGDSTSEMRSELSGLLEKVKSIRGQLDRD